MSAMPVLNLVVHNTHQDHTRPNTVQLSQHQIYKDTLGGTNLTQSFEPPHVSFLAPSTNRPMNAWDRWNRCTHTQHTHTHTHTHAHTNCHESNLLLQALSLLYLPAAWMPDGLTKQKKQSDTGSSGMSAASEACQQLVKHVSS